jgi:hypothetical protein
MIQQRSSGHRLTQAEKGEIIAAYQCGDPVASIASRFGINVSTIYSLSKSAGVFASSRRLALLNVNTSAFEPDSDGRYSPEQRYWAGFLLADGNICIPRTGTPVLSLGLGIRDEAHVRAFADFLGYPQGSVRWNKSSDQWIVQARSDRWIESLAPLGIYPQKTFSAIVPAQFQQDRHYLRGYIDGDGSVRWASGSPSISAVGTKQTCQTILDASMSISPKVGSSVQRAGNIFRITINGRYAQDFAAWLYQAGDVSLERKAKVAVEFSERGFPRCSICGEPMRRGGLVERVGYHQNCDVRSYKAEWKKQNKTR